MSEANDISKGRVLVVEDAEATWTVQELSLTMSGFKPVVCTDGASALEAIARETFDLVVLDLALPEVDGWAVLGRLRAEPRTAEVPVLIVTARDDAETQQKARLAGASGYLTKPFQVDRFQKAVQDLIAADVVQKPGLPSGGDDAIRQDDPEAGAAQPL